MTEKCLYKENFVIEFEKPNSHIYKFNGSIKPRIDSLHNLVAALDNTNFVLRGCSLKNSAFIFGLVVYTGHETKIMLNSVKARPKRSTLENLMNLFLFLIFFL